MSVKKKNIVIIIWKQLSPHIISKMFLKVLQKYFEIHIIDISENKKNNFNFTKLLKAKNIYSIKLYKLDKIKKKLEEINPIFIVPYFIENFTFNYFNLFKLLKHTKIPLVKFLEPVYERKLSLLRLKIKNILNFNKIHYDVGVFQASASSSLYANFKFDKKLYSHHHDLERSKFIKSTNNKKKYFVFLDENLAMHPDKNILKNKQWVSKKKYYNDVRTFLIFLKKIYNVDIYVAAHPTTTKNYFNEFKLIKNKSAKLIKSCSLAIVHQSTSTNFPIIYKKKIIFITTDEINQTHLGPTIKGLAKYLNTKPINLSKNYDLKLIKNRITNVSKYNKFIDNFIKHPQCLQNDIGLLLKDNFKKNY
jgi:hypothetical protein